MSQPGALSRTILAVLWLLLGIAMVAVPIWLGWTRWPAILSGHPAMLVATMVVRSADWWRWPGRWPR